MCPFPSWWLFASKGCCEPRIFTRSPLSIMVRTVPLQLRMAGLHFITSSVNIQKSLPNPMIILPYICHLRIHSLHQQMDIGIQKTVLLIMSGLKNALFWRLSHVMYIVGSHVTKSHHREGFQNFVLGITSSRASYIPHFIRWVLFGYKWDSETK